VQIITFLGLMLLASLVWVATPVPTFLFALPAGVLLTSLTAGGAFSLPCRLRPHASPEQHERAPPSGGYVERCFRRKSSGKGMAMRYARFRDEQTSG
jgi:hypothetical protein